MFARILTGKVKSGMWNDYERYYNETVVPPTQKMKGFRERRLLRSLENPDEAVSICVWETNTWLVFRKYKKTFKYKSN